MTSKFLPVLVLLGLCCSALAAPLPAKPNILFILTDDQGYGDFSFTGNPILKTPNVDKLATQSVRFTDYHVSPTCSPTRSALMTGRHEFHNGVTHTINERERLRLDATTVAQVLKSAGYTTGIFGKWHLGDEDDHQPNRRGFDEVFIHGAGGIGQAYPDTTCGDVPNNSYFNPAIKHNGVFEKTTGYCTDVFFAQATHWIEQTKDKGQPFFCYLPTNAPHAPLDVPPEYEKLYTGKVPANAAKFLGMCANIDDNVGRLMAKLHDWDIEKNTVVIFMTDNGGTAGTRVYNANMRGQKGTSYNGGTHVPLLVRWPNVFPDNVRVGALAAHIDFFPTVAEIAGATIPPEVAVKLDGRSLVPLLKDPAAPWPDRLLFTHVGRWARGKAEESKYAKCAVRNTQYNMVCSTGGQKKWELYDLKADPSETHDLAVERPEVVKQLDAAYDQWWASILPDLVNENAPGPKEMPFKEQYLKQFGSAAENPGKAP